MRKRLKKEKQNKKALFNSVLVKLAAVAVIIGCGVLIASTQKDCSEKEEQIELMQTKINAYETENAELQRVLDSDDLSAYMEKVALEDRSYAYPDERRFYDKSRD